MKNKKAVKTKKQLMEILKNIPIEDKIQRNELVCSLIGHSAICTHVFGYRDCGRCKEQLGDNLAMVDSFAPKAVIIGHDCKRCRKNYKECTWKDKIYVQDPFINENKKKTTS